MSISSSTEGVILPVPQQYAQSQQQSPNSKRLLSAAAQNGQPSPPDRPSLSIQAHSPTRNTVPQPSGTGSASASPCRQISTSFKTPAPKVSTTSRPSLPGTSSMPLPTVTPIPVTPLDNHFHSHRTAGLVGGHWRHFRATATIGQKDSSVLVFERKANVKGPARIGRLNRLGLIDLLRYDVSQLVQLAHPRILSTLHQLAENKELICLACEPIQCSLDKLFDRDADGLFDGVTESTTGDYEPRLEKLEMKLGVLQLIEGLSYLHNSAKILHGNLTPAAVFVTTQQLWKIGGFAFSVVSKKPNQYPCFPWTKKLPPCLQPDLDFLAPEYLDQSTQIVSTAADVFSLGVLICWIYAGGRRLIDVNSNLESYQIVVDQLDVALDLLNEQLGANLRQSLGKVLSKQVDQRPAVQMLALIKHFDDPSLGALRQLDDLINEFDPANKASFLSQALCSALPNIPEPLWFRRILVRFNEQLLDQTELFPALVRPLVHMLANCESHNIHRLRPWFRKILDRAQEKTLSQHILDNMAVIFRRLSDEQVEDRCFDLLITLLSGSDPHLKQNAIRTLPHIVEFIPIWFLNKRLIPAIQTIAPFFEEHIPRQIDLLVAIAHLSDRCDSPTLHYLLTAASLCNTLHPAIVHSKSRLVQRILTCDVSRLRDPLVIAHHLLNPLVLGLALPELSPAHFDDVMSSSRILLDIIEQLRYETDEFKIKTENNGRRLCNRRVSMSSNHLPRLLITAARPSIGGDGRKMSFLSADGRLEDRGSRRESRDSRCSFESEVSLRMGGGSDISDDSAMHAMSGGSGASGGGGGGRDCRSDRRQGRRRSWLEGYMQSVSLEQSTLPFPPPPVVVFDKFDPRPFSVARNSRDAITVARKSTLPGDQLPFRRAKTPAPMRSPQSLSAVVGDLEIPSDRAGAGKPARPNSATKLSNLGHNLACTIWKTFY